MSNYDDFLKILEDGVKELARKSLRGFKDEALNDAREFLDASKDDLQRWTRLLKEEKLTEDDFEWLLIGRKSVARLYALKRKGLAEVRIERFRNALIDLVIDTALDVFKV